jgi:hypothetical protein
MFKGIADAFNAFVNLGADLSPQARIHAKKVLVSAVIVSQVAATAMAVRKVRK